MVIKKILTLLFLLSFICNLKSQFVFSENERLSNPIEYSISDSLLILVSSKSIKRLPKIYSEAWKADTIGNVGYRIQISPFIKILFRGSSLNYVIETLGVPNKEYASNGWCFLEYKTSKHSFLSVEIKNDEVIDVSGVIRCN